MRRKYEGNAPISEPLLFYTDYEASTDLDRVAPPWQSEQEPRHVDPTTNRMTIVENAALPGVGSYRPSGRAMRVELRPYSATNPGTTDPPDGDIQNSSNYLAPRAEVYARHAVPGSSPAESWPDPPGAERWIGYSLLIPEDFAFTPDGTNYWTTITQFKGYRGGSPPIAVEIKRQTLVLGGQRGHTIGNGGLLGNAMPGTWCRIVVGVKYSTDPAEGWVEAYLNGVNVAARTPVATMDIISSVTDPVYLKQGIYRSSSWATTNVLYFGPLKMGTTRQSVEN